MKDLQEFEEILKRNDLKPTTQRKLIYEILLENEHEHLEAKEILNLVKKIDKNIGIATIYRTLDVFMELGLVSSIQDKYEINSKDKDGINPHFICDKCGKVVFVERLDYEPSIKDKLEQIATDNNFQMKNITFHVNGFCNSCQGEL